MREPLDKDKFKRNMDEYISSHSLFSAIDRTRVLERIDSAKRRKRLWKRPKLLLVLIFSVLLLVIIVGFRATGM